MIERRDNQKNAGPMTVHINGSQVAVLSLSPLRFQILPARCLCGASVQANGELPCGH